MAWKNPVIMKMKNMGSRSGEHRRDRQQADEVHDHPSRMRLDAAWGLGCSTTYTQATATATSARRDEALGGAVGRTPAKREDRRHRERRPTDTSRSAARSTARSVDGAEVGRRVSRRRAHSQRNNLEAADPRHHRDRGQYRQLGRSWGERRPSRCPAAPARREACNGTDAYQEVGQVEPRYTPPRNITRKNIGMDSAVPARVVGAPRRPRAGPTAKSDSHT